MKKYLIILLTLFTLSASAQTDTVRVKVHGGGISESKVAQMISDSLATIDLSGYTKEQVDSIATVIRSEITGKVDKTTTITINGVTYDLSANRSWTISGGESSKTLYTADDSLTGDRTVDVKNHSLTFKSDLYSNGWLGYIPSFEDYGSLIWLGDLFDNQNNTSILILDSLKNVQLNADSGIIYRTPPSAASTDSILTWDDATGIIRKRDASSFSIGGVTQTQLDDTSTAIRGAIPDTSNLVKKTDYFPLGVIAPLAPKDSFTIRLDSLNLPPLRYSLTNRRIDTDTSLTDKKYVDSANTLKLNITDTTQYQQGIKNKKWVIFGDSFSADPSHYYGRVDSLLGFTGTVSHGVSGAHFSAQSAKLDSIIGTDSSYFKSFDIASILLGVNDFASGDPLGSISDTAGQPTEAGYLKHMIETIFKSNPYILLYVMTPTNTNSTGRLYKSVNSAGWSLQDLDYLINQIAAYYGVQCIDLYNLANFNLFTIPYLTEDGLHPNYKGSIELASIISNAFLHNTNNGRIAPSATGIGGSGTTNYIPRFSASTTLANSIMSVNDTSVGIGDPPLLGYRLYVNGKTTMGGIYGLSTGSGYGVWGNSSSGYGVYGVSSTNYGVYGSSGTTTAIFGSSSTSYGVRGNSSSGVGVYGNSTSNIGLYGTSTSSTALFGSSTSGFGVRANSTSNIAGAFYQTGALTANNATNTVTINRTSTLGGFNTTGNVLQITDIPSGSGTISGSLINGTVDGSVRLDFNPRVLDGASAVAYMTDTKVALSNATAKLWSWRNSGTEKAYLDANGNFNGNSFIKSGGTSSQLLVADGSVISQSRGQTTLVAGTKAITVAGVTTSSVATLGFVSIGGTVSTTWQYKVTCTANTVTITAIDNTGATNTSDTSVLNYSVSY